MQVLKTVDLIQIEQNTKVKTITQNELQEEYYYWLSVKILTEMLNQGILTQDEFLKIDLLNRKSFSPSFASLMP